VPLVSVFSSITLLHLYVYFVSLFHRSIRTRQQHDTPTPIWVHLFLPAQAGCQAVGTLVNTNKLTRRDNCTSPEKMFSTDLLRTFLSIFSSLAALFECQLIFCDQCIADTLRARTQTHKHTQKRKKEKRTQTQSKREF